jgi:hypothetical protein
MSEIPVQPRHFHLADDLPEHLRAKVVRLPLEIYIQILDIRDQSEHGEPTSGHTQHRPNNVNPTAMEKAPPPAAQ